MRFRMIAACVAATVITLSSCGIPRDPENTLEEIGRRGELQVGVTESPPWIVREGAGAEAEASGIEADLIRQIARRLGVTVRWRWDGTEANLEALEAFELDLVAGGLTERSPWSSHVGVTRPFVTVRTSVGWPAGTRAGATEGSRIAVEAAAHERRLVEESGATAVVTPRPFDSGLPVAAPEWKLRAHSYVIDGEPLHETRHVLAVPPGENDWLATVESALDGCDCDVEAWLVAQERP